MTIENSVCAVKEQKNGKSILKFIRLLNLKKYPQARNLVENELRHAEICLKVRADYCFVGHEYLEFLINSGEIKEARKCAYSLREFDFDLILDNLYEERRKALVDKPYKAERRN